MQKVITFKICTVVAMHIAEQFCYLGVKIAKFDSGNVGDIMIFDDYSVIYIGATSGILFLCVTGLRSNGTNDEIGDLYFKNSALKKSCNGFVKAKAAKIDKNPGVLNIQTCGEEKLTTRKAYCILVFIYAD